MALIAQFNFTNSKDFIGELPGDLLLVFGDDIDGPIDPLHFEWQNLGQNDLVTQLPSDSMAISPCFGNRCRTVSFPNAMPIDRGTSEHNPANRQPMILVEKNPIVTLSTARSQE